MKISLKKYGPTQKKGFLTETPLKNSHDLELLYDKSGSKLFHIALNLVDDTEVAKGIVQNVFSDLWARRDTLDIKVPLEAYLVRAIKFSSIDYLRAKAVREKAREEIRVNATVAHNDTEEQMDAIELDHKIGHLVNMLPAKCQEVFRLSREKYMSNREIAKGLQISEKTVERHMTKALRHLRAGLKHS